jgi:hypothetical protein
MPVWRCTQRTILHHKVATVIVLASVPIRLPWQNGQAVGPLTASLNRDSDMVVSSILPS